MWYNENGYISKMTTTDADGSVSESSYLYDENHNLIEYHPDENSVIYYTYDNQNQIIREDINYLNRYSETRLYNYDSRGNVTSVESYDYTRGDVSNLGFKNIQFELEYDEVWLDEIASIDNMPVLYDETGNPISLADCSINWTNGRQLESISYYGEVLLSYTYDEDGIRVSKTYQGVTTYYTTESGVITSQFQLDENGSKINEIVFIYNSYNELLGAEYGSNMYYYIKNSMGDVTSIVNEAGTTVIEYCYNAWGEIPRCDINSSLPESSTDYQFAELNPMLYRSYYYDAEIGFYYLQSRYYMPQLCRFINADDPELVQMNKHKNTDTNLYSYCFNNPVNNDDKTGNWGAAVHNGYNENNNSCSATTINGKVTKYGTYTWAKDCGFNHNKAKKLAQYCEELDTYYGSKLYGESLISNDKYLLSKRDSFYIYQGWHFNLNETGTDSRVLYANRRMNDAVGFWNKHSFQKAIHHLGWGLHAVQDMEAHGQIGRGRLVPQHLWYDPIYNPNVDNVADDINYDWKNREHIKLINGDGSKWRLRSSERMSKNYINQFLNRIGGYINVWNY